MLVFIAETCNFALETGIDDITSFWGPYFCRFVGNTTNFGIAKKTEL